MRLFPLALIALAACGGSDPKEDTAPTTSVQTDTDTDSDADTDSDSDADADTDTDADTDSDTDSDQWAVENEKGDIDGAKRDAAFVRPHSPSFG